MVRVSSVPEPYRVALRSCPPPLQDAFKLLREMVRRAAPHAQERAIIGWNGVTFCSERQGFLFYIRPLKGALNLGFYRGDLLSDTIHPNEHGHEIMAATLASSLGVPEQFVWDRPLFRARAAGRKIPD